MLTIAQQRDWLTVLRVALLPFATTAGLVSLADALRTGDPRLIRRRHVEPPYIYRDMPVAAGCRLAWLVWQGRTGMSVGEVDDGWQRLLGRCADETGSPMAAQSVIDAIDGWGGSEYDAEPVPDAELLAEVLAEIARRGGGEVTG